MAHKQLVIALAGNPNAGKTTIFNSLTGSRQHVGNYPGVTVERKEGHIKHNGADIKIIDLPGTYSLTAYSPDEVVARNVILEEKPDVVINVVDGSNLERNLYLTMQLRELEVPLVLAINMADIAESNGINIHYPLLSRLLGIPVIRVVGLKGEGISELLETAARIARQPEVSTDRSVRYALEVEEAITNLQTMLTNTSESAAAQDADGYNSYPPRWLAIKLLENDKEIIRKIKKIAGGDQIIKISEKCREAIYRHSDEDAEILIADGRYGFIRGVVHEAVTVTVFDKINITEKLDSILLNRLFGLPIFLGIMWLLFQITFKVGEPFVALLEAMFASLGTWVAETMPEGLLQSLLADGVIGGVGGVVVFLPNILLLFLGIAFLEATGYMARAAFVMDKIMHRVGLHGKSFVPMLIGFGCSIPAIMATRTLENPKDRLITMLVTPLMSCGARLPVYTLLIAAFFSREAAGNILFSLYLIGILLALLMAKVFRTWLLPGESEPFVMELPTYKMPSLKKPDGSHVGESLAVS